MSTLSHALFQLDPHIRYVAQNQKGVIVEMQQNPRWPSHNPDDTDKMQELIVNPVILELASRRGNLDLHGIRYVVIRYGLQYQVVFPYCDGHVSVGLELVADVTKIAEKIAAMQAVQAAGQQHREAAR